jgi:hypothetical protein
MKNWGCCYLRTGFRFLFFHVLFVNGWGSPSWRPISGKETKMSSSRLIGQKKWGFCPNVMGCGRAHSVFWQTWWSLNFAK